MDLSKCLFKLWQFKPILGWFVGTFLKLRQFTVTTTSRKGRKTLSHNYR